MNRRGFFGAIGAIAAGFAILPPATTYTRLWKAVVADKTFKVALPNPEWVNAPYQAAFITALPFEAVNVIVHDRGESLKLTDDLKQLMTSLPIRFKVGANGLFERVSPFVIETRNHRRA